MPDKNLEKNWTRWHPEKINFTEKEIKNKNIKLKCAEKKDHQFNKLNDIDINLLKEESYNIGFQKGLLTCKEQNNLLNNKIHDLFIDFESSLSIFEDALISRVFKIIFKVSAYVIGKEPDIRESVLLKYLKKVIEKEGIFLKKPQLFIHPDNKELVEKIFKKSLNIYKWNLFYDKNIDLNGCQVRSESGYIDATIDSRWKELCRLIYSEEYQ
ncbi:flagellar assembly protein FliH [Buchnera aphidicola (Muscaphis stroyani)]|uniref:Flagellar assembly protein FliH n=1 Tax=Buchnera aphidicola (Muscaphis stroyani) TaxID=1241869 RepID=A0A4D6Y6V1_9GAMM|nr:flagellar assembly protein FliH [Buchnera aphidicola]QCI24183.1 flagellar assembly protein FliH [Buchnera aphidicola (Muscaphis stroyani)]